jgi:uncharacterized damage-inducible protein DinB
MSDTPFVLGPREGFAPAVGSLVSQLEVTRHYLLRATRELGATQLDAVPAGAANPIGAVLRHLVAAERMFQVMTFEDRGFDEAEKARWWPDFTFADATRPHGEGIEVRHAALTEARAVTLAGMRGRDDAWLARPKTFFGRPCNVLYYWTHFLLDEARHTGQVIVARKHGLPDADPGFAPYV